MMDLTPHWLQIRGRYADAHAALQWVARAIYERVEETVPSPPMDEVDLTPALELGFLASDDGKIGFSDSDIRHDYLVRHAVDWALSAWDDLETFANVLLGLAKFDLEEAHRRTLALTNTEQPILRRMGIAALGEFKYMDSERHDLLRSTLERLEVFRTIPLLSLSEVMK